MIQIKNLATGDLQTVIPTKFPDGTSQVWKLDLDQYRNKNVFITWYFEEEPELIWMNQLICLCYQENINIVELYIPFLPYGRQDKEVSNNTTFARQVFLEMLLKEHVGKLSTLDSHSYHPSIYSYSPDVYIQKAIEEFNPEIIVYPDEGAYIRYEANINHGLPTVFLNKQRNQLTGELTGLTYDPFKFDLSKVKPAEGHRTRILIIDDICDGGATFNNVAMFLHEKVFCTVGLYVTHGIFSKGYEKMMDSGIMEFYTTNSILRNINGYELEEV